MRSIDRQRDVFAGLSGLGAVLGFATAALIACADGLCHRWRSITGACRRWRRSMGELAMTRVVLCSRRRVAGRASIAAWSVRSGAISDAAVRSEGQKPLRHLHPPLAGDGRRHDARCSRCWAGGSISCRSATATSTRTAGGRQPRQRAPGRAAARPHPGPLRRRARQQPAQLPRAAGGGTGQRRRRGRARHHRQGDPAHRPAEEARAARHRR